MGVSTPIFLEFRASGERNFRAKCGVRALPSEAKFAHPPIFSPYILWCGVQISI